MKQFYIPTNFKANLWRATLLFFVTVYSAFAQNLVETEPNNAFGDAGIQEIFDRESLWGGIINNPSIGNPDPIDIWHITPTPGTDRYLYHNYQGVRVHPTPFITYVNPNVWLVTRSGGHNGPMISQVEMKNSITSRLLLDYTGTDYYYSIEVRGQDGLYNAQSGFDARITVRSNSTTYCEDPNAVTSITTTSAAEAIQINTIAAPAGGATGYMVKISDTDSFTDQMDNFDVLPVANTVYGGTGEQVIYSGTSANPNINVTGLTNETEYFVKVYAYTLCDGDFYFYNNAGSSTAVKTCVPPANPTANLVFESETNNSVNLTGFDEVADAEGYVVKVNTANSFTDIVTVASLPSANTVYSGVGEQIVYVGASNSSNVTITGLSDLTQYYVKVYGYNECLGNYYFENAATAASFTTCGSPVDGQVILAANNVAKTETSVQVQQTKPAAVDGVIIYINDTDSFTAPTTGTTLPMANATYSGSGQQAVDATTLASSSVDVTNLSPNTTYYFKAYGYNTCADGNFYFESLGSSHSDATCGITANQASNVSVPIVKMNSLNIASFDTPASDTFGNDPTGYVVVMNTTNSFTPLSTSTTLPSATTVYVGGEQVVYAGSSNTPNFNITGLTENTDYYFTIYAYKQCATNIYFQQIGYSFAQKTEAITTNLASNAILSNVTRVGLQIDNFTPAASDAAAVDIEGYVVKMNTANAFTAINSGNSLPIANTVYGGGEQVMYAGNSNRPSISITGLTENTPYYFTVYGYTQQDGIYNYQSMGYAFSQSSLHIDFTNPSLTFGDPDVTLSGNASSAGAVSFSLIDDTTGSNITGTTFTIGNAGNTTIRVSAVANGVYGTDTKDFLVTINKVNPVITWNAPSTIDEGVPLDATYLNATANVTGTFEYYTYYTSFYNIYSGRITEGVTTLTYNGFPTTIYARFIPDDTNYNVIPGNVTITVNTTTNVLEITPNDIIKALGSVDPALTSSFTIGTLNSGDIVWVPLIREPGETEGTYVISIDPTAQAPTSFDPGGLCPTGICIGNDPFGLGYIEDEGFGNGVTNNNYNIQLQTGTFIITNKEEVTITLNSTSLFSTTYTGNPRNPVTASSIVIADTGSPATPEPALNFEYSGYDFQGNAYAPSTTPPTNAGSYTVKATVDTADPNYFGSVTGNFTISTYGLTINPENLQIKTFDGTPKTFDATITGLQGENVPLLVRYDIDPGFQSIYTEAAPTEVGTYPVLIIANSSVNYQIYYNGTLTITDKALVTINMEDLTQSFDGSPKPVTISSIETNPGIAATPTPTINITYEGINGTYYLSSATPPTSGGQYRVTAQVDAADPNFAGISRAELTIVQKIVVIPSVYLQGAITNPNTGEHAWMRDDLRIAGMLPTTSPYADGITTNSTVFDTTGANAIVDWIWIELRDQNDATQVIEGRSALLQRDGDVVDIDGVSPVSFDQQADDYYIAIKHRNHLSVLSADIHYIWTSNTSIDFSSFEAELQGGSNALVDMGNDIFAIPVGDQDENGQIQNADVNAVIQLLGGSGYSKADMDMNGQIQNTDINTLMNPNLGKGEQF